MSVVADPRRVGAFARRQMPETGAKISAAEDGVHRQTDEDEEHRQHVQMHAQAPAATLAVDGSGCSSGARASLVRTQATAITTPA
jgi:hypothetical protein